MEEGRGSYYGDGAGHGLNRHTCKSRVGRAGLDPATEGTTLRTMGAHAGSGIGVRAIALAAALAIVVSGSGMPMCLTLLSQAAAPCDMHGHHPPHHGPAKTGASVQLLGPGPGHSCHQDARAADCGAGQSCPAGGPSAPAAGALEVASRDAVRALPVGAAAPPASYLAPPLFPPPQA